MRQYETYETPVHCIQLPSQMMLEEDFYNIFDNRDLNGNEPDEPDPSDSDSDLESSDAGTDLGEDEETVKEDQEQLDQVPLSFSAQKGQAHS